MIEIKVGEWDTGIAVTALTAMNGSLYSDHDISYQDKNYNLIEDGKIIQWDANRTKVHEWDTGGKVTALTAMNGSLYSGHDDGKIIQWDANRTKVREWATGSSVTALTAMNGSLYSGQFNGKIIQWDANGTKVREWDTGSSVTALTAMNGSLYSGQFNGKIIQWDANGTKVREWDTGDSVWGLTAMNGYVYSGHSIRPYPEIDHASYSQQYYEKIIIQWDANGTKVYEWNSGNSIYYLTIMNGFVYAGSHDTPISEQKIEKFGFVFSNLHTIEPLSIIQPLLTKQKGKLLIQQGELEEEIKRQLQEVGTSMQILQQRVEKLLRQQSIIQANIDMLLTPTTTSSSINPQPNPQLNSEPTAADSFSSRITEEKIEDSSVIFKYVPGIVKGCSWVQSDSADFLLETKFPEDFFPNLFIINILDTIEPLSIIQPLSVKQKGKLLIPQGELLEEIERQLQEVGNPIKILEERREKLLRQQSIIQANIDMLLTPTNPPKPNVPN